MSCFKDQSEEEQNGGWTEQGSLPLSTTKEELEVVLTMIEGSGDYSI